MPVRSGSHLPRPQPGVGQGQLGRGDAHLALAAHHLQPLADGLFLFLFQGAEVVDLAGKLLCLGGRNRGAAQPGGAAERADAAAAVRRASHRASLVCPKGLITPMPVMTTRRCLELMESPRNAGMSMEVAYFIASGERRRGGRQS